MEHRLLGRTGLKVSVMGFGCGGPSRAGRKTGRTEAESIAVVHDAIGYGVNFFDTAESYKTEEMLGKAIKVAPRQSLIVCTKKKVRRGMTEQDVRQGLEDSLKRLDTDYVDIYYMHGMAPGDYEYNLAEIVPMFDKLRREGKFRFLAISENFGEDPSHEMLPRALQDDVWDVMMVGFNILNQSARERIFPVAAAKNIGVVNMQAVRIGLTRQERLMQLVSVLIEKNQIDAGQIDRGDPLGFLVHEGGAVNMTDAGYRFCRYAEGPHVVLSGTGSREHLRENVTSFSRPPLPAADVEKLKALFMNADAVSGQ
ncbi:MAG: aldo/keto reductase [Chloroflexi bacterium]|nr:aldo/keto reductase [Chloroflexota bacterium]